MTYGDALRTVVLTRVYGAAFKVHREACAKDNVMMAAGEIAVASNDRKETVVWDARREDRWSECSSQVPFEPNLFHHPKVFSLREHVGVIHLSHGRCFFLKHLVNTLAE